MSNDYGSGNGTINDPPAPTVSSVTVPADNTYSVGDNLDFTIVTVNYSDHWQHISSGRLCLGTGYNRLFRYCGFVVDDFRLNKQMVQATRHYK